MNSYNKKIVVSGNMIEVFDYKKPIFYDNQKKHIKIQNNFNTFNDVKRNEMIKRKSLIRTKRELSRIIYCNINKESSFLTLTYEENIVDLDTANYEFKKFIKRLNSKYNIKLQYTAVVEFQERGAIHYHIILYNPSYKITSEELKLTWGNGFIKYKKIKNSFEDIEKVKNYMVKDIMDKDTRLHGRKRYFNSRNIQRPEEIKDDNMIINLLSELSCNQLKSKRLIENNYNNIIIEKYILTDSK